LKFGVDYRWLSPFTRPFAYFQIVGFAGVTAGSGGVLSGAASYAETGSNQTTAFLTQNFSFYGQDTWKPNARLSLTYGLRWDVNTALKGKNLASQPLTVINLNEPSNLALAPLGTPLYQTRYGNVAPRVGLAYQLGGRPDWGAVLRGGFGIFYDLGYGSLGGASSYFPFFATKIITPTTCPSGVEGTCYPLTPQQAAPPPFTTNPPANTMIVADPHLKVPRTYQWNVALEKSLGRQPEFVLYLHWCNRARLATRDEHRKPESGFWVRRRDGQFGNLRLSGSSSQIPAPVVARFASVGVVYILALD
jgi:TonB-dependent receptor-like protein